MFRVLVYVPEHLRDVWRQSRAPRAQRGRGSTIADELQGHVTTEGDKRHPQVEPQQLSAISKANSERQSQEGAHYLRMSFNAGVPTSPQRGIFCSSTSSFIRSVNREKGLSSTIPATLGSRSLYRRAVTAPMERPQRANVDVWPPSRMNCIAPTLASLAMARFCFCALLLINQTCAAGATRVVVQLSQHPKTCRLRYHKASAAVVGLFRKHIT
jgi:hypothetical protein